MHDLRKGIAAVEQKKPVEPKKPKELSLNIENIIAFMGLHGLTHVNTHKEYPERGLKAYITVEKWSPEEEGTEDHDDNGVDEGN